MTCFPDEILSAWLDGEADDAERVVIEPHLGACAACRARLEKLEALDGALRSLPLAAEPPATSFAWILRGLAAASRSQGWRAPARTAWRTLVKTATGVAAAGILVALMVMEPSTGTPTRALADEAVTNHLRALATGDGTGCHVASEDPGAIGAWIAEVMGREIDVPRLAGATLVGARRCSLLGEETAALVYRSGDTSFSIYLPPKGSAAAAACDSDKSRCLERAGQTVCVIPDPEGEPMLMVGAMPGRDLCSAAASGMPMLMVEAMPGQDQCSAAASG
ncbi:MAG TPA: zf-HC2 domain-containing protein [Vulgatibacter sp.]